MENINKPMSHRLRVGGIIAGVSALITLICITLGILFSKSPYANIILPVCLIIGSLSLFAAM